MQVTETDSASLHSVSVATSVTAKVPGAVQLKVGAAVVRLSSKPPVELHSSVTGAGAWEANVMEDVPEGPLGSDPTII